MGMKSYMLTSPTFAIKYKNGSAVAFTDEVSYGHLQRTNYKSYLRIKNTILTFTGELSDIQKLIKLIKIELRNDNRLLDTNSTTLSESLFVFISKILYNFRSNLEPLNLKGFIGTVDELGNSYKDIASATGLSRHLVLPILRNNNNLELNEDQIKKLMVVW